MELTYQLQSEFESSRIERWNRITTLINWFVSVFELDYIDNFFDYKENVNQLNYLAEEISKLQFRKIDFEIAYRIIRSKYHSGWCDYDLDFPQFCQELIDKYSSFDESTILCRMYDNMKLYWDDVLISYKRENYRIKRIKYLIDRLNNEKNNTLISSYEAVILKINSMLDYYNGLRTR